MHLPYPGKPKPYQVQVKRGGKLVHLGCFATAEEAALCVARSPEGQAEATKRAAAPPLTAAAVARNAKLALQKRGSGVQRRRGLQRRR